MPTILVRQNPQVRGLRVKEPTPENLRQGLPLDQQKYEEKRKTLEAERQREYNEMLQKVLVKTETLLTVTCFSLTSRMALSDCLVFRFNISHVVVGS